MRRFDLRRKLINVPRPNLENQQTVSVRILATSDLHMQMTSFDYVSDVDTNGGSLAKIATRIFAARSEAHRDGSLCLLFDNGDTLQGSPVADVLALDCGRSDHPMIACMNHLDYDACGLGNHDFDFGLEYLSKSLAQAKAPFICTNLKSETLDMVLPQVLLERPVKAQNGQEVTLRIGVLSSLPDKTALWNRHHLDKNVTINAPLVDLQNAATRLREQGADIVVVLAHMGLALFDEGPEAQNQIVDVAALDDVDVIIGGHTHLRFPGPDHKGVGHIDCDKGTVLDKPAIQPGASAGDLGIIDLCLTRSGDNTPWTIRHESTRLEGAAKEIVQSPEIVSVAAKAHRRTRDYLAQPVAQMSAPMHSFFALADPSPIPALLAAAKERTIKAAIKGTSQEQLPLISVASATLTGGFDGPENFLLLSGGAIERRHIAGMNPYANQVWAVRTTGARLLDWLERSAVIFNTLTKTKPDQMLIDPRVPGFRYDAAYGLTYQIDPRKPPLFDPSGRKLRRSAGRIKNLCWQGTPVTADQKFLVATTDHRAGGGGLYETFEDDEIVVEGHAPLQEAVLSYLQSPDCAAVRGAKPWSFPADMNLSAIMLTSPDATAYLNDVGHFKPEECGLSPEGFLKLKLHF